MIKGLKYYHDKYHVQHLIPEDDLKLVQDKLLNEHKSRRSLNSIKQRYLKMFKQNHPLFAKEDPLKNKNEKQKIGNQPQQESLILESIWVYEIKTYSNFVDNF